MYKSRTKCIMKIFRYNIMQKLIAVLFALCCMNATVCAQQTRIQNGKNAKNGQFPYHAYISNNYLFCGGSIIHSRWVITAAHCAPIFVGNYKVMVGSVRRYGGKSYGVESLIEHPDFSNFSTLNDIALVRLKRKITFGRKINKVKLPRNSELYENTLAVITGFGVTDIKGYTARILQYIYTPILEQETCKTMWDHVLLDSHICTSINERKSACIGDSGGPVVVNNTLVGIVSFGDSICAKELPCVHTRVSTYVQWIEEVLGLYSDSLDD